MNEIMNKLFEQYNFVKTWEEDNRMFYVNTDKNIISYFIPSCNICICTSTKLIFTDYLGFYF